MRIACIVKGGATAQLEGELTLHDAHSAYNAVVLDGLLGRLDRHEIGDFTNPFMCEEACDQDIRFWKIVLLVPHRGRRAGCNAEEAAFFSIQQSPEHAGCIKRGQAAPVNGAIGADKGNGMQITNDAMLFNGQIGSFLWVRLYHGCFSSFGLRERIDGYS